MIRLKFKGFTVRVYTDFLSFSRMPERPFGRIASDTVFPKFQIAHMTGFVQSGDNVIRLLIHPKCRFRDCLKIVAHELGHKVEGGFRKNPAPRMKEQHEQKANHYEQFAVDAHTLSSRIMKKVKNGKTQRS